MAARFRTVIVDFSETLYSIPTEIKSLNQARAYLLKMIQVIPPSISTVKDFEE